MWRNSVNFSSKFLSSTHYNPSLPSHLDGITRPVLAHSRVHFNSSSSPSIAAAQSDGTRDFAASYAARTGVNLSSFAAASASKVRDAVDFSRHYGRCYWELSKARLSMLVVATSGTGYVLGSGNAIDFAGLCCTCAGTMMVAASANSLNQVFEINNDAKMNRTRKRPLPSKRITIPHAIAWASTVGLAGTALLMSEANMLAAGLAASTLGLYAFVYTPLKQIHPLNTWVGAVVGAIPPLLGWAAASGEVSLNGMILPAALYFWQIPHFMALAHFCRKDYAAGGFKMFSLADPSGQRTAAVALRNCLYLLPLGFLAYDWGVTSGWFCLESSLLTLAITATAFSFYKNPTTQTAKKMFHASLLYLPVFMSGLLLHQLPDNKQSISQESSVKIVDLSLPMETSIQESENVDQKWKNKVKHSITRAQARAPVAYASAAPFPFLPAPSYAGH